MASEWHVAVCDVCRLIDGDVAPKVCFYCGACDSEICASDANSWGRRAHAAALRKQEQLQGWTNGLFT